MEGVAISHSQPPPSVVGPGGIPSIYLTRVEAALYLNVPSRWLANNARNGPRYIKVGGLVRYSVAALDEYMSAHERRR
jgi:hypothetical protein